MTFFWVLGGIGVVLLLLSLLVDDVFEGIFDALDIDAGGGIFSLPVLAGFLAAFGLVGGVAGTAGAPVSVATAAGLGAGAVFGWATLRLTRAAVAMSTDATPTSAALLGMTGRVVTTIPAGRLGEVLVRQSGQPVKLAARSERDLSTGTEIVVVQVTSSTSVVVEPAEEFWELGPGDDRASGPP